jgi:hypothetical protein
MPPASRSKLVEDFARSLASHLRTPAMIQVLQQLPSVLNRQQWEQLRMPIKALETL